MADMYTSLTPWIVLILWTAIASWVYRDNPIFRMGTVAIVAGGAANGILVNVVNVYQKGIVPILNGTKVWLVIPIILGIMLASVFFIRVSWLARYPTILMMGVSMGAMITGVIGAQILGQISDTMTGLAPGTSTLGLINALLVLFGVICSILYFTYGKEHTGTFGAFTKIGRYFLLASLGPFWAGELAFHMAFGIQYVQNIVAALRTIIPI